MQAVVLGRGWDGDRLEHLLDPDSRAFMTGTTIPAGRSLLAITSLQDDPAAGPTRLDRAD
jgi:hypothetical protein